MHWSQCTWVWHLFLFPNIFSVFKCFYRATSEKVAQFLKIWWLFAAHIILHTLEFPWHWLVRWIWNCSLWILKHVISLLQAMDGHQGIFSIYGRLINKKNISHCFNSVVILASSTRSICFQLISSWWVWACQIHRQQGN